MNMDDVLRQYYNTFPKPIGRDIIKLECSSEFEPFGTASEDWDDIWRLTLLNIPFYYRQYKNNAFTGRWLLGGNPELKMKFEGKTAVQAMDKCISFLTAIRVQNGELE